MIIFRLYLTEPQIRFYLVKIANLANQLIYIYLVDSIYGLSNILIFWLCRQIFPYKYLLGTGEKNIFLRGCKYFSLFVCPQNRGLGCVNTKSVYHDYAAVSTASGVADKMINADEAKQIVIQLIVLFRACLTITDDIYLTNICDVPIKQMQTASHTFDAYEYNL